MGGAGVCVPQQLGCFGEGAGDVVKCNSEGTDWNFYKSCPPPQVCVGDGICSSDTEPTAPIITDKHGSKGSTGAVTSPCDFCATTITYSVKSETLAFVNYNKNDAISLDGAIQQAFSVWQNASAGQLSFLQVDSGADISLEFVNEVCCDDCNPDYAGCSPVPGTCGSIESSDRTIRLKGSKGNKPVGAGYIIPLVAHEVGHSLGLSHTNGECNGTPPLCSGHDIMCCQLQENYTSANANDKAEFLSVWGTCMATGCGLSGKSCCAGNQCQGSLVCDKGKCVTQTCPQLCANAGRTCGSYQNCDCGSCDANTQECSANGACVALTGPQVCAKAGKECGTYQGYNCGSCASDTESCSNGVCTTIGCPTICANAGKQCGAHQAGNTNCNCGSCGNAQECQNGSCVTTSCSGPSSQTCGNCGTQTRSCNNGQWSPWSSCSGQGQCSPSASQPCGSGGTQVCTSSCSWGNCEDESIPCPGPSSQTCGNCGTQTRSCDTSTGQWSPWSSCSGQGQCSPGASQSCGSNSTQTCTSSCQWGACQCTSGQYQCNGSTLGYCSDGSWTDYNCTTECQNAGYDKFDYCGYDSSLGHDSCFCSNNPTCSYQSSPGYPSFSSSAPYDCPGGIVMTISGQLDTSGNLTVYAKKTDGSTFGSGTYSVRVFDLNVAPDQQCKGFNTQKTSNPNGIGGNQLTFPSFPSQLTCGGADKAYCIVKDGGGNPAHFCSGRLVVSYD